MNPKVSIIMGIYNCENVILESIESIINQTFKDWELIMCDDGSTDSTFTIAKKFEETYKDKIILIQNCKNKGLNYTLNRCLDLAKGQYIARMDADDICMTERLEKQVKALDNNKNFAIVSSNMKYFDEKSEWGISNVKEFPQKEDLIYGTPFCHAPCMIRKEAYKAVNGYSVSKKLLRVEDYHLWVKMYSKGYKGFNLKEPLYKMRDDRNAYSRRKFKYRINETYVKFLAFKNLNLPKSKFIFVFRPIIVGLLPNKIYDFLHKKNLNKIKKVG